MGKIKHIKEVREFFRKSSVVSIVSLRNFISNNKGNKNYVNLLLNNMIKKGEIKRITRGYYTIHEDPTLAVFCFKPAYFGLQNALSIHNLWEQETNLIIITTNRIRQGLRQIFENNIVLRRLSSKYFFGIEYVKEGDFYVPVSDIEKTFIDMIYFKQKIDRELLKNFRKKINIKKLKSYIKRYPKSMSNRVLIKETQKEVKHEIFWKKKKVSC